MNSKPNIIKKLEELKYDLIQGYSENGFYINDTVWVQGRKLKKNGSFSNKRIAKQNKEVSRIINSYVSSLNNEDNDLPWFLKDENDDFSKHL